MKQETFAEIFERTRPMDATFVTLRIDAIGAFITEVECDTREGFEHTAAGKVARASLSAAKMMRCLSHHEMGGLLKELGQMMQDAKQPK
jgi:hypothetical protein